ncbi:lytic polysaccharide monooxygenase [Alkalimonas collagenimarina]|uniref:Lytic polysaccharide monooxygenase n=1 Tax=Alkalimonas collagenimarina TaxID=400390 RepID=A0ABT9H0Q1_9GAMM|nr:lytic polysaccharide monooxygenase [Alkalimonas collagenimarina]MDP4536876.1 lytic polysaccharide monooxygenase [Alkalimonas collagenimarina]
MKYMKLSAKQLLTIATLLASPALLAHGYVEYPKARQQICKEDGGYWWPADGSGVSNLACRAAFLQSGGYMYTQHHEFAINISDYNNMDAVRAAIPDGTLCAANDDRKAGMNIASSHWQTTEINLSQSQILPLRFRATTPHNPSFWQFYLTKPDIDPAARALHWDDLELIYETGNTPAEAGYYLFDVPLPTDRTGPAILYTRWQRIDVVGEGFYNCSDLTFTGSGTDPIDPPADWFDKGAFVDLQIPVAAGDTAQLRVFDDQGQELLDESWTINAAQLPLDWAFELANQVNAQHDALIQIGVLSDNQVQLSQDLASNRFYLSDNSYFVNLDIRAGETNPIPDDCQGHDPTTAPIYPDWPQTDWAGQPSHATTGDLIRYQQTLYQANWWTQSTPGSDESWTLICHF